MFCPNCGTQNNDGNQFCQRCGFPLSVQPAAPGGSKKAGRKAKNGIIAGAVCLAAAGIAVFFLLFGRVWVHVVEKAEYSVDGGKTWNDTAEYTYNDEGQLIEYEDVGVKYRYKYDKKGRVTAVVTKVTGLTLKRTYEYIDSECHITNYDSNGEENGTGIEYFDRDGNLIKSTFSNDSNDSEETYTYNKEGELTKHVIVSGDAENTWTFEYDDNHDMVRATKEWSETGSGRTVSVKQEHDYDEDHNILATFTYDSSGNLTGIRKYTYKEIKVKRRGWRPNDRTNPNVWNEPSKLVRKQIMGR